MHRSASCHGFRGLGWLVALLTPFEVSPLREPVYHRSNRAVDVRGAAAQRASQDRGQVIGGYVHGVLPVSLVEAPGRDGPTADLGGFEGESAGSKRQSVADDTPDRQRRTRDTSHKSDSDSDEVMPERRKKQKVEVRPGFELTWDDTVTESFVSYAEQMGFPLGPEPYKLKLAIECGLGRGEYAKVYGARLLSSTSTQSPHVAVKFIEYSCSGATRSARVQDTFMTEFEEMATEREVSLRPFGHQAVDVLITERADTSLKQWAIEARDLAPGHQTDLVDVHQFMTSVAYGLAEMHRHGIAHRDITLDSLLLVCPATNPSCNFVFSGFGYACVFNRTGTLVTDEDDLAFHYPCGVCEGAADYVPPELVGVEHLEEDEMDMAAGQDVWAAGIVFLLLLDPLWAGSGIFKPGEFMHLTPAIRGRLLEDSGTVIDDLVRWRTDLKTSPLGQSMGALLRTMLEMGEGDRASAEECYRELLLMQPASAQQQDSPSIAAG